MRYEFLANDGTVIEENFPMATVPQQLRRKGKVYRLAISRSNTSSVATEQVNVMCNQYPRTDVSVPRGTDFGAGTDTAGHPIVKSAQHEREIMARHGFWRD